MIDTRERPFRIHPRRPPKSEPGEARVWSNAFRVVMRLARMTSSRLSGPNRSPAARLPRRQRCAVRVTYSSNRTSGQWYAHGRYIAREGGLSTDIAKTLAGWQSSGDERMFKIILSPEFGGRVDLERLSREFMERMSRDLRTPLEWVAAVHRNTDHPHVHIALRGANGLRLPRDLVKHGLRAHAEDLCTAQLGYRTEVDQRESERREIDAQHPTSLDRRLSNLAPGDNLSPVLQARLRTLERMGLATRTGDQTWDLHPDFLSILRSMKRATDRQKLLAAHSEAISNHLLPVQYTLPASISSLEGRVIGHSLDDTTGTPHMIVETAAAIHIIPHNRVIESLRQSGRLAPKTLVRIQHRGQHVVEIAARAATSAARGR